MVLDGRVGVNGGVCVKVRPRNLGVGLEVVLRRITDAPSAAFFVCWTHPMCEYVRAEQSRSCSIRGAGAAVVCRWRPRRRRQIPE